jgi:hypothetical protein
MVFAVEDREDQERVMVGRVGNQVLPDDPEAQGSEPENGTLKSHLGLCGEKLEGVEELGFQFRGNLRAGLACDVAPNSVEVFDDGLVELERGHPFLCG